MEEKKKNIISINLIINEIGLKRFNTIPTFKNLLHPNQLNDLKIGDNYININNYIYSVLTRLADNENVKIERLNSTIDEDDIQTTSSSTSTTNSPTPERAVRGKANPVSSHGEWESGLVRGPANPITEVLQRMKSIIDYD